MPQLDAILKALAEKEATELDLSDGRQPTLRFPDGDRPVSRSVLSRARIITLLSELAGPHDAGSLAAGEPVRFVYRAPDGNVFLCEAPGGAGGPVARITRYAGEPRPATATAAPRVAATPARAEQPPTRPPTPSPPAPSRAGALPIDTWLDHMIRAGASDLHLCADEVPMLRLEGEMVRIEGASALSPEQTTALIEPIMPPRYRRQYEESHDTDFAYEIADGTRFRCNVFADRKGMGAVLRIIPSKIPTVEDLGLPKAVVDLCSLHKGLVLVTGPTGSGKSTTLAALVDHINRTRRDHIITIEDPIEFVHPNRACLVNQREVGTHTSSFKIALRAALREDPDIVLVGEMRDLETIAIAIETAETGHLVFGTLHTTTAASTIDRVIDQFPADRQAQIRVMLAESLKGVVSQTLLKKIGGGRVAALEVLIGVQAISNLIREGKSYQIPSIMQTSRKHGMILLNDALLDLVKRKVVAPEEAFFKAIDRNGFASQLRSAGFEPPLVGSHP